MKERPILFSGPMVRAILAGTKTQTRRVVKPWTSKAPSNKPAPADIAYLPDFACYRSTCPYGQPGDRLWVREAWNFFDPSGLSADRRGSRAPFTGSQGQRKIEWVAAYRADGELSHPEDGDSVLWRPSIHMPRWACRILLEIVSVRIERLDDISEADAKAEGITRIGAEHIAAGAAAFNEGPNFYTVALDGGYLNRPTAKETFQGLWEHINGEQSWAANPWVWVVEFQRIEGGAA